MVHEPLPIELEQLATRVVHFVFQVHSKLGPGLLESVYEACLCFELTRARISYDRQVLLPIIYDGFRIDAGLRIDLLVEKSLVLELKSVER